MPNAAASILHLKCALVVKGAFEAVLMPEFEARTGAVLDIDWAPTTVVMATLAGGATADAVLLVADAIDELIGQNRADGDTRRVVLQSRIGVAVAKGAPHPDISDLDAFGRAMTGARSVSYSRSGQSGLHFAPLLQRLGIADAVNARATIIPAGFTAEKLVTGEADIAIQQLSELAVVSGIEIVGPLPPGAQKVTTFAAAVMTGSAHPDLAARFVASLTTEAAFAAFEAVGLDPVRG